MIESFPQIVLSALLRDSAASGFLPSSAQSYFLNVPTRESTSSDSSRLSVKDFGSCDNNIITYEWSAIRSRMQSKSGFKSPRR
jgi:hypothetical protein